MVACFKHSELKRLDFNIKLGRQYLLGPYFDMCKFVREHLELNFWYEDTRYDGVKAYEITYSCIESLESIFLNLPSAKKLTIHNLVVFPTVNITVQKNYKAKQKAPIIDHIEINFDLPEEIVESYNQESMYAIHQSSMKTLMDFLFEYGVIDELQQISIDNEEMVKWTKEFFEGMELDYITINQT